MKHQRRAQKRYAVADVVLRMVKKERDRLKLHPRAAEGFKMAIDALFRDPALDRKKELEAVVRLAWLFKRDEQIELAESIAELIAQEPRALSVLGISAGRTTREAKTRFAKLVAGAPQRMAAPVFGSKAPQGSMKVSSFIDPSVEMRRRAGPRRPVAAR